MGGTVRSGTARGYAPRARRVDGSRAGARLRDRPLRAPAALHRRRHGQPDRLGGADRRPGPLHGRPGRGMGTGEPDTRPGRRRPPSGERRRGTNPLLRRAVVRRRGTALQLAVGRLPLRAPRVRHGRRPHAPLRRVRRLDRPVAPGRPRRRLRVRDRPRRSCTGGMDRPDDGDLRGSGPGRPARPAGERHRRGRDPRSGRRPGQCRRGLRGRLQPCARGHRQPRPSDRAARRRYRTGPPRRRHLAGERRGPRPAHASGDRSTPRSSWAPFLRRSGTTCATTT